MKLRVGLLGCGRVASRHVEVFRDEIQTAKVVAVCDKVESRALERARQLGAAPLTKMEDLLTRSDIDLVMVLTESGKHSRHARAALEANKHVIVEKPAALFPQEVIALGAFAKKQNKMYAVIYQNRFNRAIKALKTAFDANRFGKVTLATVRIRWCRYQDYYEDGWHGTWKMDGGVINQQAIHHLDVLQWICGPVESVVSAQAKRLNVLEAEDTTVAALRFKSGALGVIEATTAARPRDFEASISVVGEKGTVVIGGIALNQVLTWEFTEPLHSDREAITLYSEEVPTGYGLSHGPFIQEIMSRIQAERFEPPVSVEEATHSIQLVHALYRSSEDKGWVDLNSNPLSHHLGRNT